MAADREGTSPRPQPAGRPGERAEQAGTAVPADERDMAILVAPRFRALAYRRIGDGWYGMTEAWDLRVRDASAAIAWCDQASAGLDEPHRIELYALLPIHATQPSQVRGRRESGAVAALLQAWDAGVEVTEDESRQIASIRPSTPDR